jgi:hypothetical protein
MSVKREVTTQTISAVLAAIITTGIALAFQSVRTFVISIPMYVWWSIVWLWNRFMDGLGWFVSPVQLPRWIAYLLIGYVTVRFGRLILAKIQSRSEQKPYIPTVKDFTEFRFKGLTWRWQWHNDAVSDLVAFCPNCDRFARYSEERRMFDGEMRIFCNSCPSIYQELAGKYKDLEKDVILEIVHLARTGGWKQWVKSV